MELDGWFVSFFRQVCSKATQSNRPGLESKAYNKITGLFRSP